MRGVNDWNVPGWRDPSAYPSRATPAHVWAWEFLRRNPEYRRAWTEANQAWTEAYEREQSGSYSRPVTEDQETWLKPGPDSLDAVQKRFGLGKWHDPRVNERGKGPYFVARGVQQVRGSLPETPHQLAYVFDLQLPLDAQFEHALADAKAIQSLRVSRGAIVAKPSLKVRTDKYALYLRLLDAEADDANRFEIAHALFGTAADPAAAFENHRRAAQELRDGGYRALATAS